MLVALDTASSTHGQSQIYLLILLLPQWCAFLQILLTLYYITNFFSPATIQWNNDTATDGIGVTRTPTNSVGDMSSHMGTLGKTATSTSAGTTSTIAIDAINMVHFVSTIYPTSTWMKKCVNTTHLSSSATTGADLEKYCLQ